MTHSTAPAQVVHRYRQFVPASGPQVSNFSATADEIVISNDKIAVLNDAMLTRISIDPAYHHGLQQLNVPVMYVYVDDPIMGTGYSFALASDRALSANELQEIITDLYAAKVKPLVNVTMPAIDDRLIDDALIISAGEQ